LDRLTDLGFSEEDVQHFRLQFYANQEDNPANLTRDIHELEEEWMQTQLANQGNSMLPWL